VSRKPKILEGRVGSGRVEARFSWVESCPKIGLASKSVLDRVWIPYSDGQSE